MNDLPSGGMQAGHFIILIKGVCSEMLSEKALRKRLSFGIADLYVGSALTDY
jgi:hypothetical protein